MIEDEESIQVALMEVINHLMCGTIELKRAELIIRALHIAVKNANRVHFGIHSSSMVKDVPDYREPETTNVGTAHVGTGHVGTDAFVRPGGPEVLGRSAVAAARENPAAAMAAHTYPARVETADVKTARVGTGHVGTGAFARPAGPAVSVRSAVPTTKPAAQAASLSHEEFAANLRANRVTASATPQRKPAVSVPASVTQPPKERKNAAHGASRE
jgi:hypothetical protein